MMLLELKSKVRVNSHRHPDVLPGTEGVVDSYTEEGYGVAISGTWAVAGGDRGQSQKSIEVCWYPREELTEL